MQIGAAKERLSVRVRLEEKNWLHQEAGRRRISIGELVRRIIGEQRFMAQSGPAVALQDIVSPTWDHGVPAVSERDKRPGGAEGFGDD